MQPAVAELYKIQSQIYESLDIVDNLNGKYKQKQQRSFINTFLQVMDRMGNQLEEAHKNYQNIDKQILADKKCVLLSNQLEFFKKQSILLKNQFNSVQSQLEAEKQKKNALENENEKINKSLVKQVLKIEKYKFFCSKDSKISQYRHVKRNLCQTLDVFGQSKLKDHKNQNVISDFQHQKMTFVQDQKTQSQTIEGTINRRIFTSLQRSRNINQPISQMARVKYQSKGKKKHKNLQLSQLLAPTSL